MPVRLELSAADHEVICVIDGDREFSISSPRHLLATVSRIMSDLGDKILDRELVIKIARPGLP